jgi:hypothetical protein
MVDVTNAELKAAEARGRRILVTEPRASSARYDRATGRVVIDLTSGCTYAFPTRLVQDLQGASEVSLEAIQVDGLGLDLHWPTLGVDLYVPALVSGVFGTRVWMAGERARIAGQTTSRGGADATRKNGAKSGRTRKVAKS